MKLVTSLTLAAALAAVPATARAGACSSEQGAEPGSRCDVSRPQVSIAATPATPHAGADVTLRASGTGRGLTYAWDLDDDGEFDDATGAEATRSFTAGASRVRVRATDWEDRTAAEARTLEVHAGDRPPTGALSFSPAAPRVGVDVVAYASGQDTDGRIARVDLDLDGDGTYEVTGADQTARTRFAAPGKRTLRARFVDDGGNVSVTTTEVDVHAGNTAPVVRLNVQANQPKVGEKVNLWAEASDADDDTLTYAYDLDGNGSFETAGDFMLETSYATAGTRDIGVRVTDAGGASATARASLTIREGNEPPAVTLERTWQTRTVFASGADADDGMPADFSWDLDGDGAFDDASGFILNYLEIPGTAPGTFDVGVRVTDNQGATAIARRAVTIHALPVTVPSITVTPAQPRVGDTVTFDAETLSDDIGNVTWTGATTPDFDTPLHATATFDTPGTKSVQVAVSPRVPGASATARVEVSVSPAAGNLAPAAAFTASPGWPRTGTEVTLTDASTDADGTIAARAWDLDDDGAFDDGAGAQVTRTFATAGNRTVALRVTDDDGAESIQRRILQVHDGNLAPRAVIRWAAGDGTLVLRAGETATLSGALSSGADDPVASYAWDKDGDGAFDDGNASTLQVGWGTAGIRTVRLRVTEQGGASDVATVLVDVRPAGTNHAPVLSANGPGVAAHAGVPVTLSAFTADAESDPVTIAWDLDADGDYDDATGPSVQHTYAAAGDYPVRVRASDGRGGVRTALFTVGVIAESGRSPVILSIQLPQVVRPERPASLRVYAWDPDTVFTPAPGNLQGVTLAFDLDGDGQFNETPAVTDPIMGGYTWTFPDTTPVTVRVRAKDATDRTTIASLQVTPVDGNLAPVPSIGVPLVVAGTEATFFAQATDADSAGATTFAWDADDDGEFDDGTGFTLKRTFAAPGTYTVRLRATDGDGASAVVARTFGVGSGAPVASFTAPSTALVNTPVSLASTTSGAWDLDDDGDFDDATGATASVTFATAGAHLVGLKVRNADGDLGIRYASIDVTSPAAATPTPTPTPPPAGRIAQQPLTLSVVTGRTPKLAAVLKSGLSVTVRCSASCRTTVVASVDKKTAKKLHLRSRTIGRGIGFGGAVRVKLNSEAKRALKRVKSVKLLLTITAVGADGLGAAASQTLTLKR